MIDADASHKCEHEWRSMGVPGSELTEHVCVKCGAVLERFLWKKASSTDENDLA